VELDGAPGRRKTAVAYAAALIRHPSRRRHTQTRKQKRDAGTSAIAAEEEGPEIPRQRGRPEGLARIWNWLTLGTVGNVAMGVTTASLRDPQTLLSFANVSAYVTRRRFLASQMFFARSGASAYDDDDDSRVLLRSFLKSILDGISAKRIFVACCRACFYLLTFSRVERYYPC